MKLSDRAITDRADDVLNRWGIARTIYGLIADAKSDSALRIGVYGGWGEGKTSVLRFVEALALKADIPVCWFSVWAAQTQPDLWVALFDALQTLPQTHDRWGRIKSLTSRVAAKTEAIADLSSYTKAAHSLAKLARLGPEDAERMIARLASKRVIVLVDDVDRVDSALIPKLLMGLHELFDELGRCAFVIAVDPEIVTGGLSQLNPAWSSAPAFLEKIVQYPFWLPRPTQDQMRRLVLEALRESELAVPAQAFVDVLDLLPPNPRKIKQFVRSLQRLQPTLVRYGDDEWNPTLLLLLDLLRTVSAEVADVLLQDPKFLEEWAVGRMFSRKEVAQKSGTTKDQHARIEAAVLKAMPRASDDERATVVAQISKISSAATERLAFIGTDDAVRHTRLDHEPPVMTLREFNLLNGAWRQTPSAARLAALLSAHAASTERAGPEVLEACALALLRRRAESIRTAADVFDGVQADQSIRDIDTLSSLLDQLIAGHNLLGDTRVPSRVEMFLAMRKQTAQATNRLNYTAYEPIRQRLRDELFRSSVHLRDRAADVLKALKPWDKQKTEQSIAGAAELNETRGRLHKIFSEFMCDPILDRFGRRGGMAAVGTFMSNPVEVWMLISPDSIFHAPECRARLLLLTRDADEVVAQNFFVYLSLLLGDSGGVTRSPLAADASLVLPAWQAASRVRPQPSMRSEVAQLVKHLREVLADQDAISMPSWVESDSVVVAEVPDGSPEGPGGARGDREDG